MMKRFWMLMIGCMLFMVMGGLACADWINVYGDSKRKTIYRMDDRGTIRSYNSINLGNGQHLIIDSVGNATTVNDMSEPEPKESSDFFKLPDPLNE
ncbi:MAG: hypothetical protein ACLFUL_12155 [Desulfobacteraceae bacterium]